MLRTQISLTEADRAALDAAAARTGRSISALIRDAVGVVYSDARSPEQDLAQMRRAFGSWAERGAEGGDWVDRVRSGRRLRPAR